MAINQPFFTIAGICVPSTENSSIEKEVIALKGKYNLSPNYEFKAAKLIGTRNEGLLLDILNIILERNYIPFFTILEKKYMVCCRIIEDFFDPMYNSNTDNSWTHPSSLKTEIADFLHETLLDETIKLSSVAVQKGSLEHVSSAFGCICRDIKGKQFKLDIQTIISGALPHLESLSKSKIDAEEDFKRKFSQASGVLHSPNLTTYFEMINRIENFYRGSQHGTATVVFDSAQQFDLAFANLFTLISKSDANKELRLEGKTPIMFGFKHLTSFKAEDSKQNVFLQFADTIASSINALFNKIAASDSSTKFSEFESTLIALIYKLTEMGYGDWIISAKVKKQFGNAIRTLSN